MDYDAFENAFEDMGFDFQDDKVRTLLFSICNSFNRKNEAKVADEYEKFARKNKHTPISLITQENVKAFVRLILMEEDREKMVKKDGGKIKKSILVSYKLRAVEMARNLNNSHAAKHFNVDESMIRDWRRKQRQLLNLEKINKDLVSKDGAHSLKQKFRLPGGK